VAPVATLREIVATVRDNDVWFMAASFAYYAFVSILPLLVLLFAVVSALRGEALAQAVVRQVAALTPTGQNLIRNALTGSTGRLELSIVSALALTWSAVKVFRSLKFAFSRIYDATTEPTIVEQLRDGLVVVLAMGIAFVLMVVVSIPAQLVPGSTPLLAVVDQIELFVGLVVAFFPLYYVLPPARLRVRDALPGTTVAAVGWLALQVGFRFYAENARQYAAYGVLGAVLLFVAWLYVAGFVLLVGACVNAVLAGE
jgi:membrane protein